MTEEQIVRAVYYGAYGFLFSACAVGIVWALVTAASAPKAKS